MVEDGLANGLEKFENFSKTVEFDEEPPQFSDETQFKYQTFLKELYKEEEEKLNREPYEETPPAPGFVPAGFMMPEIQSRVRDLASKEEAEELEKEAHDQLQKRFIEEDLEREELEREFNEPQYKDEPYILGSDKE